MALTAITGVTKLTSQKSARQMSFSAKEETTDSAVDLPASALKNCEFKMMGIDDENAFGPTTIGQKGEGVLLVYAADNDIRTFCHELVTKTIKYLKFVTISGQTWVFESSTDRPAIQFAYGEMPLVSNEDNPITIELKMTAFRDNLVTS